MKNKISIMILNMVFKITLNILFTNASQSILIYYFFATRPVYNHKLLLSPCIEHRGHRVHGPLVLKRNCAPVSYGQYLGYSR